MNNHPAFNDRQQDHAVMLPCSPDQFGRFISGLLGKPQTITQSMRGAFDISAIELMNIHQLIDQRIRQQNQGELIQFTVRIIFNDDSSVLLNSYSDLQHYNEVRPVVSKQVHLSWSYLIRFADRNVPEKQSIDLSFLSGPALQIDENDLIQVLANRKPNNVVIRI